MHVIETLSEHAFNFRELAYQKLVGTALRTQLSSAGGVAHSQICSSFHHHVRHVRGKLQSHTPYSFI